jgi:hypothetical protein
MKRGTRRTAFRIAGRLAGLALLLAVGQVRAASPDGPYLLPAAGGWEAASVVLEDGAAARQTLTLGANSSVMVPAVGPVPGFAVRLRGPAAIASDQVTSSAKAPLFIVADTHGEYEILVAMLRAHEVVGPRLEWKFARGHLVVLGDVFDRGPNHLEILWLLYKLEAEAQKAGGGVHLVLGNHETMVMRGDLRYLHPKYQESAVALGARSYAELFAADTLLGQWLRTRPSLVKVNDSLCVHAGVSRAVLDSTLTLAEINGAVRAALAPNAVDSATAQLVMGSLGPLWYRGYFAGQASFPAATMEDIDLTLKTFGVRRVLIGHTIVPTLTPLYAGKVIAVQVQPKRDDAGHASFESLVIRNGELWQAKLDGSLSRLSLAPRP